MKQKQCFKCSRTLALSSFYRHAAMGDGHLNKCIDCTKRDVRSNYAVTRAARSQYEKARFQTPERKASVAESMRRLRKRHPEKVRAWNAVKRAVRNGRLVKAPCVKCGDARVQGHHEDYSKPLDVMWLCFRCHRAHHGQVVVSEVCT